MLRLRWMVLSWLGASLVLQSCGFDGGSSASGAEADAAPAIDAGFDGGSDASPDASMLDAAPADAAPGADAAIECGDVDEPCCAVSPTCGDGDPFIECNEETSICEECGADGQQCCQTGEECQDSLLGCLLGICTPLL